MNVLKFTEEHEWIRVDGDVGTVGITDYAQQQLGDIVYVELPARGAVVAVGDEVAVVESVKAASEIYAPVSGEVVEVNQPINDRPATVNESAMTEGWFFKLQLSDAGELMKLMDETAYAQFVEEGA